MTEHSDLGDFEDFLEHFGRKGMKWGEHIFGKGETPAPAAPKKRSSADASRAEKLSTKAGGGTHTLSNKELQDLVTRMNLEQQYSKLTSPSEQKKAQNGKNFVQKYNGHAQTGVTAFKTTKEVVKIVGPLLAAAAAAAAASKATGNSGPVKMPRLAIGS